MLLIVVGTLRVPSDLKKVTNFLHTRTIWVCNLLVETHELGFCKISSPRGAKGI